MSRSLLEWENSLFGGGGGARYNIATLSYVIIIKKMIINTFSGYTRSGIFSSDAANTMLQHSHAPEQAIIRHAIPQG